MMKKSFLSFAMMAAFACVMAACGNKSANNAEAAAEGAEQEQEQVADNILDGKRFSTVVPEGWEGKLNHDSTSVSMQKGNQEIYIATNPFSPQEMVDDRLETETNKQLDDLTVDGVTYKVVYSEKRDMTSLYTERITSKNSALCFDLVRVKPDDADAKAVIASTKQK